MCVCGWDYYGDSSIQNVLSVGMFGVAHRFFVLLLFAPAVSINQGNTLTSFFVGFWFVFLQVHRHGCGRGRRTIQQNPPVS